MAPYVVQVVEAFEGATSLQVELQGSDVDASATRWDSPVTLATSAAVPVADLVAGYQFTLGALPIRYNTYLRLYFTVVGGPFTAGAVDAGFVADRQTAYLT